MVEANTNIDFRSISWSLGDLTIDMQRRRVLRGQDKLDLGDLSLDVLIHLAEIYPDTTSPEQLARDVWKQDYVNAETLSQRIALIRRALGETAKDPRYIRTVRNKGYVLAQRPLPSTPANSVSRSMIVAGLAVLIGVLVIIGLSRSLLVTSIEGPQITPNPMEDFRLVRAQDYLDLHQPDETNQAITLLENILNDDPDNMTAQTQLSFALSTRVTKFDGNETDLDRAESLARALIEQDSSNANAWHALGYALDARGRIDEALSAYQLAYQSNPSDAAAMSSAAYLLQIRGRLAESLELETRAWTLNQGSLYAPVQIYNSLRLLNLSASDTWLQTASEVSSPNLVTVLTLAESDVYEDQIEQAIERLSAAPLDVRDTWRWKMLRARLAVLQDNQDLAYELLEGLDGLAQLERLAVQSLTGRDVDDAVFEDLTETLMAQGDTWPELRVRVAEIFAAQDDLENANTYLIRAIDLGWRDLDFLQYSPYLRAFRQSAYWSDITTRIEREISIQKTRVQSNELIARHILVESD